jgi:hypothetical protein
MFDEQLSGLPTIPISALIRERMAAPRVVEEGESRTMHLDMFMEADIIFADGGEAEGVSMVYGADRLRSIIASGAEDPVPLAIVKVGVDFDTDELEALCAMCSDLRGACDYPSDETDEELPATVRRTASALVTANHCLRRSSEWWFMSRRGHLQYLPLEDGRLAFPVAEEHGDAIRLARWLNTWPKRKGRVSPAKIGSINGETLDGIIRLAIEAGCSLMLMPNGWNQDGSPAGWARLEL